MPNLFGLRDLDREQILGMIEQAHAMAEILGRPVAKAPALQGRKIAMLFFEASTRTRTSFELAAKSLSADVINFSPSSSSLSKGETLLDTAMTIKALGAHAVVVRDRQAGMPQYLSRHLDLPVVNAGDGTNEHPTQALLDLSVLATHWSDGFEGKTLAIIGDVARSRVARSHLWAAGKVGMKIRVIAPATFLQAGLKDAFGVDPFTELAPGLDGVDAVMALRVQHERNQQGGPYLADSKDYFSRYGLTPERMETLAPGALLLHPGPVNRGVELSHDLLYKTPPSLIQEQVAMGVALRMAVLYWALRGSDD